MVFGSNIGNMDNYEFLKEIQKCNTIENDNEKEGMIFKPVIDEFKDNTRNEFIDFDNVISKFRTVLERDLKNNKEKEKEEEFEK